jgi:hypothetical protein
MDKNTEELPQPRNQLYFQKPVYRPAAQGGLQAESRIFLVKRAPAPRGWLYPLYQ